MELETVEIKVEKGVIPDDVEIVVVRDVCTVEPDGIVLGRIRDPGSASAGDGFVVHVVSIKKILKPDWNPPKLKQGWLTWDDSGGWWWWPNKPEYNEDYGWVDAKTGYSGGDGQEIAVVMAKFLGCPDCNKFDERECIWEVGR